MRLLLPSLAVAAVLVLRCGAADACINVTKADLDESVRSLKIAEGALEGGDLPKATRWLDAASRFLEDVKHSIDPEDGKVHSPQGAPFPPPDAGLYRRAARLRALIRSRSPKATPPEREAAVQLFEKEVLGPSPDPTLLADYAEALSRVPARAAQAAMMLRALRDKDLIGSAFAYAALAAIEKQAGDEQASGAARERCRTMAKKPAICG
jgi:hypothetical protein